MFILIQAHLEKLFSSIKISLIRLVKSKLRKKYLKMLTHELKKVHHNCRIPSRKNAYSPQQFNILHLNTYNDIIH